MVRGHFCDAVFSREALLKGRCNVVEEKLVPLWALDPKFLVHLLRTHT
jgi:hypothetical protein